MLQDIYSSDAMRKHIVEAYRLGIEFTREAILYYLRSTYRRVLEAIIKPPQLDLDIKISAVTNVITEIEKESRTLNSKRLHEVQQRLDMVERKVDGISNSVEGAR